MSLKDSRKPVSLYIHFPWCVKKCPYCDFNSHTLKSSLDEDRYIAALIREFDESRECIRGCTITSIFLGGGTPSLFHGQSLDNLLAHIRGEDFCCRNPEITLEANPGTLEYDSFESYLAAGINRLSLGIQSFDDQNLKALGRIHDGNSAQQAIDQAHQAGFANINLDLMFGIPGQDINGVMEDARTAIAASPQHISYYQLTIEPNTLFYRNPPRLPPDDMQYAMQQKVVEVLADSGYERYEVSAYARKGYQSRHNLNYWNFGDYLGIGAGAHSKLTGNGTVTRSWNEKQPARYLSLIENGEPCRHPSTVHNHDLLFEFMLNGLRLKQGFSLALFEERTGLQKELVFENLAEPIARELLIIDHENLKCSDKGYLFIDEILQHLLP
jgi:oxygen-independent coproporphyrinogen-3 oxidase